MGSYLQMCFVFDSQMNMPTKWMPKTKTPLASFSSLPCLHVRKNDACPKTVFYFNGSTVFNGKSKTSATDFANSHEFFKQFAKIRAKRFAAEKQFFMVPSRPERESRINLL